MNNKVSIKNIIENKNLEVQFEPVISVVKKSVIGFHVSSSGCTIDGENIPMEKLLELAREEDMTIELDRLYREKAVEKFSFIYDKNKDLLLYIKLSASIISRFIGSGIIMDLITMYNIDYKNIVLEIIEDRVEDVESIKKFINFYRSHGFLVSLSDIGYGLANLDKISYIEPDIIKISGAITENIDLDYYKQEIFKALVTLSKSIGAFVIGDGIKTRGEALTIVELGADMLQGEYFRKAESINKKSLNEIVDNVKELSKQYKEYLKEKADLEKNRHKIYMDIINENLNELSIVTVEEFQVKLKDAMSKWDIFECIYILDEDGIQVTDTFTYYKNMISQRALLFPPVKKGTDHSLKKYYYLLKNMKLNKCITEPYVSLATGNLCITISSIFKDSRGKEYIFCVDFDPDSINI